MTPEGIKFERQQNALGIYNTIDWCNKDSVIAYAKSLGAGMTVYKHPDRPNYNITHTVRTDLYRPEWVVARIKSM